MTRNHEPDFTDWRALPAAQQPAWPDTAALRKSLAALSAAPPLVSARECDQLRDRLAAVAAGKALLLQGGDCAEVLDEPPAQSIGRQLNLLLQMATVLSYATAMPIVKVGRIAGQYAKPRSKPTETQGDVTLPSYQGDAVNGLEFTKHARRADPARLEQVYHASAATLRHLRMAVEHHRANLEQRWWNRDPAGPSLASGRHGQLADEIDAAFTLMRDSGFHSVETFVSHEALLLDYESALTRIDEATGDTYALSGHLVWIGERTRQLDGAHVAFAAQVRNPIGVKLGPSATVEEVLALLDRLDPERIPGRLTFIARMGHDRVRDRLPELASAVAAEGSQAVWVCDPMHGNTFTAPTGHKTRDVDTIAEEVFGFLEVHATLGTHPGGIHLEFTGEDVTECVGGDKPVHPADLLLRYKSACDPRLNRDQSMDLAFRIAERYIAVNRPLPRSSAQVRR